MTSIELRELDKARVAGTYRRYDLSAERGRGATCFDYEGKDFIDFSSGIGVNSLGYCDEGWIAAVTSQLGRLQHTSNLLYTEPCAALADALVRRGGLSRAFFCNSGAEANEGAIKCARKYARDRYGEGRHTVVSLTNSFHGRTLATLSATGQDAFHNHFHPFPDGFAYAPPNDIVGTLALLGDGVCAVMMELIQGEGGIVPLDVEYVSSVVEYCLKNDILIVVDEVQTGVGRTGTLFCFERYGFFPDIVTVAKGLGGGLPLGAILFGDKTGSTLGAGDHATTFGGNPVACAGAIHVLDRIDGAMLAEINRKGDYIRERMRPMPRVAEVGGMGLMIGATLNGADARSVVAAGIERGVILLTAKDRLRLLPPLTISDGEIEAGLDRLEKALRGAGE